MHCSAVFSLLVLRILCVLATPTCNYAERVSQALRTAEALQTNICMAIGTMPPCIEKAHNSKNPNDTVAYDCAYFSGLGFESCRCAETSIYADVALVFDSSLPIVTDEIWESFVWPYADFFYRWGDLALHNGKQF